MVVNGQVIETSPADRLRERLDDPAVADSLHALLDHVDLLAVLVVGLDGLVRRGDVISDNLSSTVGDLRGPAESLAGNLSGVSQVRAELGSIDVPAVAASLAGILRAFVDSMPVLDKLLHSPLTDPKAADVLVELGTALVEGQVAVHADASRPKGLFGLWRVSKDEDIKRGLGFLVHVARAFGRQLPG